MSDSVRPQRQQPPRLCCPWDSPGKNTGVGCHFLLQCMKVKSESEVAQSRPTLSNPMDCSLPGSSAHGIFQARVQEWGATAFSGECSTHPENVSSNTKRHLKLFNALGDSEINQLIFRICPGWGLSGGLSGAWHWGCSLCRWSRSQLSDWLYFRARSYHDLNQPTIQSFPSVVSSLMSLPDGLTSCTLEKVLPVFIN